MLRTVQQHIDPISTISQAPWCPCGGQNSESVISMSEMTIFDWAVNETTVWGLAALTGRGNPHRHGLRRQSNTIIRLYNDMHQRLEPHALTRPYNKAFLRNIQSTGRIARNAAITWSCARKVTTSPRPVQHAFLHDPGRRRDQSSAMISRFLGDGNEGHFKY